MFAVQNQMSLVGFGRFVAALFGGAVLGLFALASGCGKQDQARGTCGTEFVAQAGDFTCIGTWATAGSVRISNVCGKQEEAMAAFNNPHEGMVFPVGTILQAMPIEAMVKRGGGFDPENGDWEYFSLGVHPAGTVIKARGTHNVSNPAGSCMGCHTNANNHDSVCGMAHQCPPTGARNAWFTPTQSLDPRCLPTL